MHGDRVIVFFAPSEITCEENWIGFTVTFPMCRLHGNLSEVF